jgi:ABC-type multidrug transport system fused ATPase/permease subunit
MSPAPTPDVLSLIGRQKAEFGHASRLRTRTLHVQLAIGLLGVITVFVTDDRALYIAAIVGVVLAAWWLWLTNELAETRSHAERIRRATMIAGGLGLTLDGVEMFELENDGRASKAEAKRLNDPNYFASKSPPGVQRLVEMLEESAIWTANLTKIAAREAWIVFGLSIALPLLAILCALAFATTNQVQIVSRVLFAMLVVLLSVDFLGAAISFSRARGETLRVIDKLQRLKTPGASLEAFILLFADYNAAVEEAPVFSAGLYPRNEKQLNEQYNMHLTGRRVDSESDEVATSPPGTQATVDRS